MRIRHGKLLDVIGPPARHGGLTFVPAVVELDGMMFEPAFHLNKLPAARIPPILHVAVKGLFDVAWVRARLPHAFGISPDPTEQEKGLLNVDFVAVRDGADEGTPFELSDSYGRTSLTFSALELDESLKQEIAEAFWNLLLSEPQELADFSSTVLHDGAGIWLHYGCERGEPYCHESSDEGED